MGSNFCTICYLTGLLHCPLVMIMGKIIFQIVARILDTQKNWILTRYLAHLYLKCYTFVIKSTVKTT